MPFSKSGTSNVAAAIAASNAPVKAAAAAPIAAMIPAMKASINIPAQGPSRSAMTPSRGAVISPSRSSGVNPGAAPAPLGRNQDMGAGSAMRPITTDAPRSVQPAYAPAQGEYSEQGPSASQAEYNSSVLPPQQDDSEQWNDPAPRAVMKSAASTPPPPRSTVVAPSLWTRILTFLGFVKSSATIHGETMDAIGSTIRRARNGDQNAMAIIAMVRENSIKGNPLARESYSRMEQFIKANPVQSATHGGEHNRNPDWTKAVYLSNGPLLSNSRIGDMAAHFGEEGNAFIFGVECPEYKAQSETHHHGKVIGMARKLQAVRMRDSRISDYSPTVGWELGE